MTKVYLTMQSDYLKHINLVANALKSYPTSDENSPLKANRLTKEEIKKDWENRCSLKGKNSFFFVMDLRNAIKASKIQGETEAFNIYSSMDLNGQVLVNGANEALDLEEGETLNHQKFLSLIHPAFLKLYLEQGAAAYQESIKPEKRKIVLPLKHAYVTSIPLRVKPSLRGAKYLWAYQKAYAYQVNKEGYILSHLNEYTFFEPFDIEADRNIVMYFEEAGNAIPQWSIGIHELLRKRFFVYGDGFTEKDLKVFKGRADGKKYSEIADEMNIAVGTIKSLNRNNRMTKIMKKIIGRDDFSNIDEIANYLRQLKII